MDPGEGGPAVVDGVAVAVAVVDDVPQHAVVVVGDAVAAAHNDVVGAVVEPQVEEVVDDGQSHAE